MNTTLSTTAITAAAASQAISRLAPLWPLNRFVAVNPFVGLSDHSFESAMDLLRQNAKTPLALPPSFYKWQYDSTTITNEDIAAALLEKLGTHPTDEAIEEQIAILQLSEWPDSTVTTTLLFSHRIDQKLGTRWTDFITGEISKWCTAYFDQGQALWKFPWKNLPLFAAWKQAALNDCNPAAAGLSGWQDFVSSLSEDPLSVIEAATIKLQIPDSLLTDHLYRLLFSVRGWSGHLQFLAHEGKLYGTPNDHLLDLLAIRISYECLLVRNFSTLLTSDSHIPIPATPTEKTPLLSARIWQRAHEIAMQRKLFAKLAAPKPTSSAPTSHPSFQAIFCIDVRSEVYRRALESVAPQCQTIGFAGFFGFPIEAIAAGEESGTPQCPVLLTPAVKVPERTSKEELKKLKESKRLSSAWNSFKSSAVSSFVFVDTAGIGFISKLVRDLLHKNSPHSCDAHEVDVSGIPLETQIAIASGALKHLGYQKRKFSRLVLFCGHGSETTNNPYASSLDCGACGGHTGKANARTAAAILNNPAVRAGIAANGISIPEETFFLAGLHNTTTDEVTLYDTHLAPSSHQQEIKELEKSLKKAGALARRERSSQLDFENFWSDLNSPIGSVGRDWSQVRPEWGLAGNYAFIAAPREKTLGLKLDGRVFLHDYDYEADPDEGTLELLLAAPVVVASWINLQYFASTVDNSRFGSGDKTLHNVAGKLGVFEGNGGDLRVGLPFQSVNDGTHWRHDPLRLAVCVEAPKEAMDRILQKHPEVAALVTNQWIHLYALNDKSEVTGKSDGKGGWI